MLTNSECSRLAEAIAKLGVDVIGLTDPINAHEWCNTAGVRLRLWNRNIDGRYRRDPEPTIFLRSMQPRTRQNFTLAHELAHHLLEDCRRKSSLRLALGDYGVKLLNLM